jgi:hypothetical protein
MHAGHLRETIINVDLQRNAKTYRRLTIDSIDYDFSYDNETLDKQLINFMTNKPSSNEAQLTRWVDKFVLSGVDAL